MYIHRHLTVYEVGSERRNTLGVVVKAYPTAGKTAKGRPHANNFRLIKARTGKNQKNVKTERQSCLRFAQGVYKISTKEECNWGSGGGGRF